MNYSETVYQITDDLVEQLDFKDEIQFLPATREEREALLLLQNHKVVIIGSRYSKNFLYPGENFNKCLNQGSRKFFSLNNLNDHYSKFPEGYSKSKWSFIVAVVAISVIIIILLYFTVLEINQDQFFIDFF